jgi:hypothetical protein
LESTRNVVGLKVTKLSCISLWVDIDGEGVFLFLEINDRALIVVIKGVARRLEEISNLRKVCKKATRWLVTFMHWITPRDSVTIAVVDVDFVVVGIGQRKVFQPDPGSLCRQVAVINVTAFQNFLLVHWSPSFGLTISA